MTPHQLQTASNLLWHCWQRGERIAALPESLRPSTREQGYAVQALMQARSAASLFGWKIAATSKAGQAHIGVDGPLAGRLFSDRVYDSGAEVPFGNSIMRVAEAEFAFRMAVDLPPRRERYRTHEVMEAVASMHPSIEFPDSRYDDFTIVGAPQLIADDACANYFVFGPAAPSDWRSMDLVQHSVRGTVDKKSHHDGCGANVLGDPREALTWLVNEMSSLDITVGAGHVITTGTCIAPLPVAPGDRVVMDFGTLGSVAARVGK